MTEPIDINLSSLNWAILSPWTKTVQVVKYWFGYWLYTGITGGPTLTKVEKHLNYINNEKSRFNNTGKSYIHNQWGDLNAYAQLSLDKIQRNEVPTIPYKDLVGSWLIWIVLILVMLLFLRRNR